MTDAPSNRPKDNTQPAPINPDTWVEGTESDGIQWFRTLLISKYPSYEGVLRGVKIEALPTKDLLLPATVWPFIFIMDSLDGRKSSLYFDSHGNVLFDSKKEFSDRRNILRLMPWEVYFRKHHGWEDYEFVVVDNDENSPKEHVFQSWTTEYNQGIVDLFIRFKVRSTKHP